ncbi:MAG: polymerase sigma factor SigW-like protein [Bacilli bacterium]|nr:polymerase sigma factor SigW-like protein [Bacilli bacterium]
MPKHLVLLFASDFQVLSYDLQLEVYKDFYVLVYPMVFFIIKDHGMTEDIIQEAFLRSIKKSSQLQDWDKMEGWLKTLTRNVTLNFLQKIKRNRDELDAEDVFEDREVGATSSVSVPIDQEVEMKIMEESIVQYLAQLKPEFRQIFEMRWFHHMSYKEMAIIMNVSEGIIKQRLFRAREAIKQKIEDDWTLK